MVDSIEYTGFQQVNLIFANNLEGIWCRHAMSVRNDVQVNKVSTSHCLGKGCAAFRIKSANREDDGDYVGYCGAERLPETEGRVIR